MSRFPSTRRIEALKLLDSWSTSSKTAAVEPPREVTASLEQLVAIRQRCICRLAMHKRLDSQAKDAYTLAFVIHSRRMVKDTNKLISEKIEAIERQVLQDSPDIQKIAMRGLPRSRIILGASGFGADDDDADDEPESFDSNDDDGLESVEPEPRPTRNFDGEKVEREALFESVKPKLLELFRDQAQRMGRKRMEQLLGAEGARWSDKQLIDGMAGSWWAYAWPAFMETFDMKQITDPRNPWPPVEKWLKTQMWGVTKKMQRGLDKGRNEGDEFDEGAAVDEGGSIPRPDQAFNRKTGDEAVVKLLKNCFDFNRPLIEALLRITDEGTSRRQIDMALKEETGMNLNETIDQLREDPAWLLFEEETDNEGRKPKKIEDSEKAKARDAEKLRKLRERTPEQVAQDNAARAEKKRLKKEQPRAASLLRAVEGDVIFDLERLLN